MPKAPHAGRSKPTWSRLDGIDALRALAIFYVLMNHINMRLFFAHVPYLQHLPRQLALALVWQGQAGVQIFFAISGFLITSTSLQRWGTLARLPILDFYRLRFARIAPLLLSLLALLSLLHALHVGNFVVSPETGGLKAALTAALTLRIGLLEATKGYLPGNWDILWSLSVEEMFYLFFPLACRLLRRPRWLVLFLTVFVLLGPFGRTVLTHGNATWQEYSYLGGMDAIALGCLTALFLHRRAATNRPLNRPALLALTVAGSAVLTLCLGFSITAYHLGLDRAGLGMTWLTLGTCMLLAVAAQTRWQAPRLLAPLLTYGRRSYEIYLTHMFVVFAGFDLFLRHGKPLHLVPLLFVAVIVLAGVLGELVGRLFSEPANRWLRTRTNHHPTAVSTLTPT
jgi:peptidoglycan/LPS O-acetylase OafA/YrhL